MMRWRSMLWGVALCCGLTTGCRQQLFIAEKDLNAVAVLPPALEKSPLEALIPHVGPAATPPDVDHPDRPARHLTLQEAMAIALENGTSSSRGAGQGNVEDVLASSVGDRLQLQSDAIRVLALNPAISAAGIENQLARFDTQWVTSMQWQTTDALQQGLQSFQNGHSAAFATSFIKALPTGGTANISFLTDYRLLSSPPSGAFGVLNPQYTSRLIFGIDHPLWRDYGSDINYLLQRHPSNSPFSPIPPTHAGSFASHVNNLTPFGGAPEGILIARVRHEQQKAEFERQLHAMLLNVEVAYWKLYQAYGQLYSFEEVMRIAHKSWTINYAKFQVGTIGPANYYPILGQYQEFRGERFAALANVIERERNLRGLMGLPIEDGTRLVPVTAPTLARYQPNYEAAVRDAITLRPELVLSRENLRVAHFQLIREKNALKPDLRGAAQYSPVGFGTRLDGDGTFEDGTGTPRPSNAFRSLSSSHFNDWTLGLILNVPLGYRAEMANVRAARLSLAQSFYFLKDQEERAQRFLTQQYQELSRWYNLIETRRAERQAYAESVEARFKEFAAGKTTVADFLLEAQRRLATAQVKEYEAIAEYNNTLARFEWSKGTILHHNNVFIAEGPMPEFVAKRAVEHERDRTKAHLLRYKPLPVLNPGQLVDGHCDPQGEPMLVDLPVPPGVQIPSNVPPIMEAPRPPAGGIETLPTPREVKPAPKKLLQETPSVAPPASAKGAAELPAASKGTAPAATSAPPSRGMVVIEDEAPAAETVAPPALPRLPRPPVSTPALPSIPELPVDMLLPSAGAEQR